MANKSCYLLVNSKSGWVNFQEYMTEVEVEKRNEWLHKFASPNLQWVLDVNVERMLNDIAMGRVP